MNAPRVKSVKPLQERRLLATFINGIQKVYDCNEIMHLDRFRLLQNEAFFKTVTVDSGGYGVSWNDETDLSEYELWNNGLEIGPADKLVSSRGTPKGQVAGKGSGILVHPTSPG
ncbi:MAG: DUF2442 domain-containing protein [bacterium]